MKKYILSLLVILVLCLTICITAPKAHAATIASGTCGAEGDNLTWTLDDEGMLTISGTGEMADYDVMSPGPWLAAEVSVKNVTIEQGVTSVGYSAFMYNEELETVTLPASLTSIGGLAFSDCTNLSTITIPEGLRIVGSGAFDGTAWFDNQPDGMIYIGKVAYQYKGTCPKTFSIKAGTLSISGSAFAGCTSLSSIAIPDSVTAIGSYAFYECSNLKNVTIPSGVTTIEYGAFEGCTDMTSVTIPDSVTTIKGYAFHGCKNLTSVTMGDDVISIGQNAFDNTLWYKNQPDGMVYIGKVAYRYKGTCEATVAIKEGTVSIACEAFYDCTDLTSVTIPDSVKAIDGSAFGNCTGLTSVTIPGSVTTIGSGAFDGCSGLASVTISDGVKTIEAYAFQGCTALTSVTIPDGVTSIGMAAFQGCTGLTEVKFQGQAPEIGQYAFDGVTAVLSYPSADTTWLDVLRPSLGGSLTWNGYDELATFDIDVARMILGNSLEFQFGVAMSKIPDTTDMYAVIEKTWADGTTTKKTIPANQWGTAGQYWAIIYDGLAAKEMGDTFYVTIYNSKGQAISNPREDSVRDYVERAYATQSAKGKTMMVDMLNYGAAAQLNFNYGASDLANNRLTEEQKTMATAQLAPLTDNQFKGPNCIASRLILESRIQMQIAFSGLTADMYAIYSYTDKDGNVQTVRVEGTDFIDAGGVKGVELNKLVYADARALVSIIIYNYNGSIHAMAADSIESYASRSATDVVIALMKFADSARKYLT